MASPPEMQTADSDVVIKLTATDPDNTPCSDGREAFQAFLCPRPPTPSPSIRPADTDGEQEQYKATFDLRYTGECELSVLENGSHIRGSPFVMDLDPAVARLLFTRDVSALHPCKGTLQFPNVPGRLSGVAVAPNGCIFVSDFDNHRIHVFDAERKFVRSIGEEGEGDGQLKHPGSVVVTPEGLLYIASSKRVDVLKCDGAFVRHIGTGVLNRPWDVAVHDGEIFVADFANNCVTVLSPEGDTVRTIGRTGCGTVQFSGVTAIAVSPEGELFVSDRHNDHLQVITPRGVYSKDFDIGQLKTPQKLRFSRDGRHLLAADNCHNRIAVFSSDGVLVSSLPCASEPFGLAVDPKGDLLVACFDGKCVQIF